VHGSHRHLRPRGRPADRFRPLGRIRSIAEEIIMRINKKLVLMLVVLGTLFVVSPAMAAEEGGSPFDALGINLGFLIAQIVNFGLIFALLTYFLWGPMTKSLDERSARIEKGLEDAAKAAEAR